MIAPLVVLHCRRVVRAGSGEVKRQPQGSARPRDERIEGMPLALRVRGARVVAGEEAPTNSVGANCSGGASGDDNDRRNVHGNLSCQVFQGT